LNSHPRELSIIVLPFKNLSDDPANEYFADGIREDILNNLYWITSLRIVSNTTSENFRENKLIAREIARQMKVDYVLEGSVRRYGDKVRISIQLIDPKRDDHLWANSFDRDLSDIIHVQNEIALQVADKLKTVIPENEIRQIEKISTKNPKAYDYYLQARFLLHQANSPQRSGFNATGVINSVQYYEKAIAEDPGFAEAYAGLANATTNLTAWGIARDTGMVNKVYQLCRKAIGLDPECAEAHAVLGLNFWFRHDFKKSGEEYKKAIDLNPNFATARQWYAQYLMITGPISEARKQIDKAIELEPFFWVVKNLDSWIAYFEKDYKRSLEVCQVAHDLNPVYSDNMWLFFLNYVKLNQGEKARDQIKAIAKQFSKSDDYAAEIDEAYASRGIKGILTCMIDINKNRPVRVEGLNGHPFYIAWWNAILGNKQEALYWLEQTITHKFPPYHYLNLIINHPDFEILHDDPRFTAIAKKIGLEAWLS
jgi:TolB-like protein